MLRIVDSLVMGLLRLRGWRARRIATSQGHIRLIEARGRGALLPVVALHGLSGSGTELAPVLERLRPHVRHVMAIDLPGHGGSDVPRGGMRREPMTTALREALDAALSEPSIFFGNSLGGLSAIRYALERQDQVAALVLSSPGGAAMDSRALSAFLASFQNKTFNEALGFVDRLFARPPRVPWLVAAIVRLRFARASVRQLLASVRTEDLLAPGELADLSIPTHV